jgi:hypothetical protein
MPRPDAKGNGAAEARTINVRQRTERPEDPAYTKKYSSRIR